MYTKRIRFFVLIFLSGFVIMTAYSGLDQYNSVNQLLNASVLKTKGQGEQSLTLGNLKMTKTKVQDFKNQTTYWRTYATVSNINKQTPSPQLDAAIINLNDRQQNRAIYGLQGYPSFMVKQDDLSFWQSQFYLQILFYFGGMFIVGILYILYYEINYRKDNKLFVPEIKNVILSFSYLFSFGAILKWGLDFRLFNFLNDQFYLGEPTPPISTWMIIVGAIMLFMAIVLQRAVKLQDEQDLTI